MVGLSAKLLQSCLTLVTPCIVAHQAPSSVPGILQARVLEWVAFPGDLPDPGIEPMSTAMASRFFTTSTIWETQGHVISRFKSWFCHLPEKWN